MTSNINCCNINAFDFACDLNTNNPAYFHSYITDPYGSTHIFETIFLVSSNFFLLFPALYALLYKYDFLRFNTNIFAFIFSCLFHLCKAKNENVGICIMSFCLLRTYDYIFSISLLNSLIFLIQEYIVLAFYLKKLHNNNYDININDNVVDKYKKLLLNGQVVILIINGLIINVLLNKSILCVSTYTTYFFLIVVSSTFLIHLLMIGIFYKLMLQQQQKQQQQQQNDGINNDNVDKYYNKNNKQNESQIFNCVDPEKIGRIFIGTLTTIIAFIFFFSRDYIDTTYYWLFHSLWHISAAISQIAFLNVLE